MEAPTSERTLLLVVKSFLERVVELSGDVALEASSDLAVGSAFGSSLVEVQEILAAHIDDHTKVIVAHSLGSVAAFEACHTLQQTLPLLVTLGSPLGLDTIVWDRTIPTPLPCS
jgi:hypothetical protein